ncbi:MAG: thiolase C-terminal domain-containing protein [Spirochaetaceae bacterium]
MSQVSIIGAYNSSFGAFIERNKETGEVTDKKSIYELLNEAVRGAVEDARIDPEEIDGVWVTSFAPGLFTEQDHLGPLPIEAFPEALRFKPSQRVEGACASGSMGIYNAVYGIESGRYRKALVVGVEKMNLLKTKGVTHALATASYWPTEGAAGMTFPGLFAEYAKGYRHHYNLTDEELREMLAYVSALMYKNGIENPLAHFSKGSPPDRYGLTTPRAILDLPDEKNPLIAEPLRLHDCSLITDGAAAVVLAHKDEVASNAAKAVEIAGIGHASERLPIARRDNMHELLAGKKAVDQAYREAGISVDDLDLAEVHDCFTINQLLSTEALGLSRDGHAGHDYKDGRFTPDDRCPVNLSGGLKAKGHPVGATGVSMHALVYKQLVGDPIGVAPSKGSPEIGVTLNVGGSAATNAVTVLRRTK